MINVPYDELIERILENSTIEKGDLEARIAKKLSQLAGLISKEGAAHIVANELNIVFNESSKIIKIKSIVSGLRDIGVIGKITQLYELREFDINGRKGKVASLIISDESGRIRLSLWGGATDKFKEFNVGDVLKVENCYSKENKGYVELSATDRSVLTINPEGIKINEASISRKNIVDLSKEDVNVEISGVIVDVSEPRFYEVSAETGKKIRPEDLNVSKKWSYVINLILDDGSGNVRCVFFGELCKKIVPNIEEIRVNPEIFEEYKKEILGKMVKLQGRVNKNELFDRLEFIARSISELSVEEEISKFNS